MSHIEQHQLRYLVLLAKLALVEEWSGCNNLITLSLIQVSVNLESSIELMEILRH